jgi:hypothetical protein
MSAWIIDRDHLDLLLTAALAWEIAVPERADDIGRMLWSENLASVAYRYPDDRDGERPGPLEFRDHHATTYRYRPYRGRVDPDVVETAARSLAYQSCEHPGWDTSTARQWITRVQAEAARRIPDYTARYGPVDPQRQAPGERGWYVLIDEHGTRSIGCGDGWDVPDRDVFTRAAALRTAASRTPAYLATDLATDEQVATDEQAPRRARPPRRSGGAR